MFILHLLLCKTPIYKTLFHKVSLGVLGWLSGLSIGHQLRCCCWSSGIKPSIRLPAQGESFSLCLSTKSCMLCRISKICKKKKGTSCGSLWGLFSFQEPLGAKVTGTNIVCGADFLSHELRMQTYVCHFPVNCINLDHKVPFLPGTERYPLRTLDSRECLIWKALSALNSLLPPTHPQFPVCREGHALWTVGHLDHWMAPPRPAYMTCMRGVLTWTQRMRQVTSGQARLDCQGQSVHSGVFGPKTCLLASPLILALPGAWHAGGHNIVSSYRTGHCHMVFWKVTIQKSLEKSQEK